MLNARASQCSITIKSTTNDAYNRKYVFSGFGSMFSFVFAVRLLLLLLFLFKQHSFAAINVWKKAFHRWGFVVVFSFYFFWNFSYLEIYYPNRVGSQALCNTSICGELFGMQQSQISQTYSNRFYGSFMLMQPDSFLAIFFFWAQVKMERVGECRD